MYVQSEISYLQVIYILCISDPPDNELQAIFEKFSQEKSRREEWEHLSANEQLMRLNEQFPKFNVWCMFQTYPPPFHHDATVLLAVTPAACISHMTSNIQTMSHASFTAAILPSHTHQGRQCQQGEMASMEVKRGSCHHHCAALTITASVPHIICLACLVSCTLLAHCSCLPTGPACPSHFPCCLIALPPPCHCPCPAPPADASYVSFPSSHLFFPPPMCPTCPLNPEPVLPGMPPPVPCMHTICSHAPIPLQPSVL